MDATDDTLRSNTDPATDETSSAPNSIDQSAIDNYKSLVQLLQLPPEKIAVEIHQPPEPKGFWRSCRRFIHILAKDYGTLFTSVVSVAVTIAIAYFAQQINQQQVESTRQQVDTARRQSKSAQEQVKLNFIKEFRERLGELTDKDQRNRTKKNLAAISLAQYGEGAFSALRMSLGSDDEHVREGAAVVLVQMLSEKDLHELVISNLKEYFINEIHRTGVLECYLMFNRDLINDNEFTQLAAEVRYYINPMWNYSNSPKGQHNLLLASKVFSNWPSRESAQFLLDITRNPTSDNHSLEQAANYLTKVTEEAKNLSDQERKELKTQAIAALAKRLSQSPAELKPIINEAIIKLQAGANAR